MSAYRPARRNVRLWIIAGRSPSSYFSATWKDKAPTRIIPCIRSLSRTIVICGSGWSCSMRWRCETHFEKRHKGWLGPFKVFLEVYFLPGKKEAFYAIGVADANLDMAFFRYT